MVRFLTICSISEGSLPRALSAAAEQIAGGVVGDLGECLPVKKVMKRGKRVMESLMTRS